MPGDKREKYRANHGLQIIILCLLVLAMGFAVYQVESVKKQEAQTASMETVEPVATEPLVQEPNEISLIMVGDILLHDNIEDKCQQEDGSYNYSALFENVDDEIAAADLALVNQEVIIGGEDLGVSGYPTFNAPYELADYLVAAGFDVILHGTNHALDRGATGITNCLNNWATKYPDIAVLGIHDSQEDQDQIYVYEQDGIKVAILNYTYGTNGIEMPSSMPYGVDLLDEDDVVADIQEANQLADFVIVCPHWGTEYNLSTDSSQSKWTSIFLENGVDLVIGTHPHVIEPIEVVTDEETGNSMLVYYSLGNFCSWTSSDGTGTANRSIGGMAEVTLQQQEDGSVIISDYGIQPLICHLTNQTNGVTVYNIEDYTEDMAAASVVKQKDANFSLEYAENLCTQVWGDLWIK